MVRLQFLNSLRPDPLWQKDPRARHSCFKREVALWVLENLGVTDTVQQVESRLQIVNSLALKSEWNCGSSAATSQVVSKDPNR